MTKDYDKEMTPFTSIDYYSSQLKIDEVSVEKKEGQLSSNNQSNSNVQMLYVYEGEGSIEINGDSYPLKAGDMALLLSYHIFKVTTTETTTLHYFQCSFSMSLLLLTSTSKKTYIESIKKMEETLPIVQTTPESGKEVHYLCKKMMKENSQENHFGGDLLSIAFVSSCIYIYIHSNEITIEPKIKKNKASELLQYIHFYHQKELKIEHLVTNFSLSKEEIISRLFQLTGKSFAENLNQVRIYNAMALLTFQELSINQIGRIVGYQTDASFYKQFKRINQMTPKDYRHIHCLATSTMSDNCKDVYCYIYNHYSQTLTLESSAKEVGMSVPKITQLIKETFSCSFKELVNFIRLSVAKGLLSGTNLSISVISEQVGFHERRTFTQAFQQVFKMTPQEFRRKESIMYHKGI